MNIGRPTVEELKKLATIDIGKYIKRDGGRVEANVKEKIIIPLLSFLGYDKITDMDFERNVRNKFIDIAIILSGKPKLIVETKDLSENLDNHVEQALNYAFFTGVDYLDFVTLQLQANTFKDLRISGSVNAVEVESFFTRT